MANTNFHKMYLKLRNFCFRSQIDEAKTLFSELNGEEQTSLVDHLKYSVPTFVNLGLVDAVEWLYTFEPVKRYINQYGAGSFFRCATTGYRGNACDGEEKSFRATNNIPMVQWMCDTLAKSHLRLEVEDVCDFVDEWLDPLCSDEIADSSGMYMVPNRPYNNEAIMLIDACKRHGLLENREICNHLFYRCCVSDFQVVTEHLFHNTCPDIDCCYAIVTEKPVCAFEASCINGLFKTATWLASLFPEKYRLTVDVIRQKCSERKIRRDENVPNASIFSRTISVEERYTWTVL
jgi:hypothetical protein